MSNKYLKSKKSSFTLFILAFTVFATVYMSKNMFSAAMASIVETGIMSKGQTGAISGVYWVVYSIFQIPGGFAADKFSPSKLVCIGLMGSALSNLVIYFNQDYAVIMAAWIFSAVIQFGLWPSLFRIISTELEDSVRSTAIFWMSFSGTFGMAISMLVASFVTSWVNNFLVAFISTTIMLIVWLILYRFFKMRMVEAEINPEKSEEPVVMTNVKTGKLFYKSGLYVIAVIAGLSFMIDNSVKLLTPTMLMESYEKLPASISNRLSVILVVFSVIGIFFGRFVYKKCNKNELKPVIILFFAAIPLVALVFFVGKIHYLWILLLLSLAVTFLHGAIPFVSNFVSVRYAPYGKNGAVAGIINATMSFGNVGASFLFAKLSESVSWGIIALIWTGCAAFSLLLCISVFSVWTRFINTKT